MRSYGPAFADGYWTMIMLVLAGAVSAVLTPVASAITASGRMWAGFQSTPGGPQPCLIGGWYLVQWGPRDWPPRACLQPSSISSSS